MASAPAAVLRTTAAAPSVRRTVGRRSVGRQSTLVAQPSKVSSVPAPAGLGAPRLVANRRQAVRPLAAAANDDVFGMDTSEGLFGFTPFAELWVGRLAMMGFITSIVEEGLTGQGTLQQIGITPSLGLFATMLAVFGGATLAGTGATIKQYNDGKMTNRQLGRVRGFLRLGEDETAEVQESARQLKTAKDPVRYGMTDDEAGIAAARASTTPADEFLGDQTSDATAKAAAMKEGAQMFAIESTSDADAAASDLKNIAGPSVSLQAKDDIVEQSSMASSELAYAKDVEMRNGRYAMIGFLAAILVEAATGHGIIMQLVDFGKLTGLLGAESGF
eukprot:jgi/Tetstr1/455689/TSEL_042497.t1